MDNKVILEVIETYRAGAIHHEAGIDLTLTEMEARALEQDAPGCFRRKEVNKMIGQAPVIKVQEGFEPRQDEAVELELFYDPNGFTVHEFTALDLSACNSDDLTKMLEREKSTRNRTGIVSHLNDLIQG